MKKYSLPGPVKIITGLIFKNDSILDKALFYLKKKFGPVDLETSLIPFNHTTYYNDEMGSPLKRKFLSFRDLKGLKNIYKLKLFTEKIENKLSLSGKRRINIDPGYLTLAKLVLFSTKDYIHRIHLGKGIYAEITLFFKDKSFRPWEWTYPDYKTKDYIDYFNRVRAAYLSSMQGKK